MRDRWRVPLHLSPGRAGVPTAGLKHAMCTSETLPYLPPKCIFGFPGGSVRKDVCQCRRLTFAPWVRETPWRRKRHPTPVLVLEDPMEAEPGGLQSTGSQKSRAQLGD